MSFRSCQAIRIMLPSPRRSYFLRMLITLVQLIALTQAAANIIQDDYNAKGSTKLSVNYGAISETIGVTQIECITLCNAHPCCRSVITCHASGAENLCSLYDTHFHHSFLTVGHGYTYIERQNGKCDTEAIVLSH